VNRASQGEVDGDSDDVGEEGGDLDDTGDIMLRMENYMTRL
jgi:hypothetical protein